MNRQAALGELLQQLIHTHVKLTELKSDIFSLKFHAHSIAADKLNGIYFGLFFYSFLILDVLFCGLILWLDSAIFRYDT